MDDLQRFSVLARQLEAEEISTSVLPITRTGQQFDRPRYARNTYAWEEGNFICNDNGKGCGKAFADRVAKKRHQHWCMRAK